MKRGLKGQGTRGIRLRADQEEKLAYLMSLDPELDISTAIRIGLDKFIEEQMARVGAQVHQSASASPPAGRRNAARSRAPEPRPDQQAKMDCTVHLELSELIDAWQRRHKVQFLAAAARAFGVPYHTFRSWSLGNRRPDEVTLQELRARLLE
jgi:hypothetical protein